MGVHDFTSAANMVDWVDSRPVARMERSIVDAVCSTVIWVLWTYRNAVVFKQTDFKKNCILDKISDLTFIWFSHRNTKAMISWTGWIQNPLMP